MAQSSTPVEPLLQIENLGKTYPRPDSGGSFTVLEGVNLEVRPGEIVALLGRSGSGKSTLLRIVAGLVRASTGGVRSAGRKVDGPNQDVAMVFQSFALLPWLTVLDNVLIGVEAKHLNPREARNQAVEALRMVGLEGFERAYPRELSGGMQQRVGFARAFVVRPRILLLDEPFSALDVLTAENLRGEIGDLWEEGNFPAESVVLVTHNIEEAIMLADRIVILSTNPGRIRGEIRVTLERPRARSSKAFRAMTDHVYTLMTNPDTQIGPLAAPSSPADEPRIIDKAPLPHARPGAISGLLELIEEYGGPEDVAIISERLRMEADDLLPILDAAVMLGFAVVHEGDASLTEIGKKFAKADPEESREIFREVVLTSAPMVTSIYQAIRANGDRPMKEEFFLDVLDESFSEEEAQTQFNTAVNWGQYAGLFEYDSHAKELHLPVDSEE